MVEFVTKMCSMVTHLFTIEMMAPWLQHETCPVCLSVEMMSPHLQHETCPVCLSVEMMSPRLQHETCPVCLSVEMMSPHLQHEACPVCLSVEMMSPRLQHEACPVCLSVEMMSPCSNIKPVLCVWVLKWCHHAAVCETCPVSLSVEMMSPQLQPETCPVCLSVEMMSPCCSLKPVLSVSAGLPVTSRLWSYTRHGDWQQELWPDTCGGGVHHGALAGQDLPREGFEQSPEAEKSQQTGEEGETEILAEGQSGWRWNAMGLKGTRSRGRVCMEIKKISICGFGLLAVFYVLGKCWPAGTKRVLWELVPLRPCRNTTATSGASIAQGVEHWAENSGTAPTRVWFPSAARVFLPESAFTLDLLQRFHSPHAHASTSVRELKTPNTDWQPHTTVWMHEKILYMLVGIHSAVLAVTLALPRYGKPAFARGNNDVFMLSLSECDSNKAECVDVVTTLSAWLRQSWMCWCCHFQTQSMTLTKLNVLMLTMLMSSLSEHDFNKADCVDVECVDVVTFRLWAWLQQSWRCWCCHFQTLSMTAAKLKVLMLSLSEQEAGNNQKQA